MKTPAAACGGCPATRLEREQRAWLPSVAAHRMDGRRRWTSTSRRAADAIPDAFRLLKVVDGAPSAEASNGEARRFSERWHGTEVHSGDANPKSTEQGCLRRHCIVHEHAAKASLA